MSGLASRAKRATLRAITRLPGGVVRRLAGPPVVVDGQTLDPLVQLLLRLSGHAEDIPGDIAPLRGDFDSQGDWLAPMARGPVEVSEMTLPGGDGQRPVRRYRPQGAGSGALLFLHGGGYVGGSLNSHDDVCRALADRIGAQVFALDYRLAPEHPFPAAPDDAVAAFRGLVAAAPGLGVDPGRIAVGGDSAGGGLAAVIAQACRADAHPPCFQMLWVPWVDLADKHSSYGLFGKGFFLEEGRLDWYRRHYLGAASGDDPRASPLRGDLRGVAPAGVLVAALDPLRDEGEAYAARLRDAGVPVTLHRVPGVAHVMLNVSGWIPAATPALEDAAAMLRRVLA